MLLWPANTVSSTLHRTGTSLDAVEELLLQAAKGHAVQNELSAPMADLEPGIPALDVAAIGRSDCEVALLSRALGVPLWHERRISREGSGELGWRDASGNATQSPPPLDTGRIRYGYQFYDGNDRQSRVYPRLAQVLAHATETGHFDRDASLDIAVFDDLWRVDWHVASLVQRRADPREIAMAWLTSPGRRLLRDPSLLECVLGRGPGATDWSWPRLLQAAGIPHSSEIAPIECASAAWHHLHDALPGISLARWQPERQQPIAVLQFLEDSTPLSVRAAALLWLLNHAMDNPVYESGGLPRDLRRDLDVPLLTCLSPELALTRATASRLTALSHHAALRWENEPGHASETLALLHAGYLALVADPTGANVRDAWGVARWLLDCLLRSPFLGINEETLELRLRVLLAPSPPDLPQSADLLHPLRFSTDGTGLDVADVAFLSALHAHYDDRLRAGRPKLVPPHQALEQVLRRLAARCMNIGERLAEERLAELQRRVPDAPFWGDLGWPAPHVAPPILARYLLTRLRLPWLASLDSLALHEVLEGLCKKEAPRFLPWLAVPLHSEGPALPAPFRDRAVGLLRDLIRDPIAASPDGYLLVFCGAGLLEGLTDSEDVALLLQLAQMAPCDFRPAVLDALIRAAERTYRSDVWQAAVDQLKQRVQAPDATDKERIDAALALVQRAAAQSPPSLVTARALLLKWVGDTLNSPPFTGHLGLRRALRTFGLLHRT